MSVSSELTSSWSEEDGEEEEEEGEEDEEESSPSSASEKPPSLRGSLSLLSSSSRDCRTKYVKY